ncbi:MAG TPA: isocitrate/isopropylmalate dehydrogenase family protein [Deinococcales bacterium]|nr:isocitrate/isopropylmalate dehydrogenase family protein [Deinococcales bacterium]
MTKICLIPGDGIGPEVLPAAVRVLDELDLGFEYTEADAGWAVFERTGTSVPEETLAAVKSADAALAGAFTSPSHRVEGHHGAIRYMRKQLDLFANLRPARSRPVKGGFEGVDMLMVRENTQGLYVEQERRYDNIAIADCVVSREASHRIAHVAFQQARARRGKLAIIHKANVLPLVSGLFLETCREVAKEYPDVEAEDVIVDAAAMKLVREPGEFDVLVSTNLFGDILSDLMAGLVGGMGLAPSANVGTEHAVFEPVHGSAPDIAGRGIANPSAMILTVAMMLRHLGHPKDAERVDLAVNSVLSSGPVTADLGGNASTAEMTDAIIAAL